ncbi:hypothetical protein PFISCL1PPCAC_14129, partial [Pristionchus fissidentatus]
EFKDFLDFFPALRHLSLTSNSILQLGSIASRPSKLQILELQRNGIVRVSPSALSHLNRLHTLDLSGNEIVSLPTTLRDSVPSLEHLRLHGNPLHCDCRLKKFISIIGGRQSSLTICETPE